MLKRKPLRKQGISETSRIKREIQATLRELVMKRDGGCILRNARCGADLSVPGVVFQADHLIERSNSATYAESRLAVCVCKACHGWKHFKKSNHDEYDALVRGILTEDRVALWDRCRSEAWRPRAAKVDWKLALLALQQELRMLKV